MTPTHPSILNAAMKQSAVYAARTSRPNSIVPASDYFKDFANYLAGAENIDELSIRQGSLEAAVDVCGMAIERGRSQDRSSRHVLQQAQSLFGMATSFAANTLESRVDARRGEPSVASPGHNPGMN